MANERRCIAWSDVSPLQRVHVLVLEHHTQLTAFTLWARQHDARQVRQLMHQRGVVWDRNTLQPSWQRCYLLTATLYVTNNEQAALLARMLRQIVR